MSDPVLAAIDALGDKLSGAIADLRSEITDDVTELRTAMMARMDRLQARIDQLGDETFVAYAQHEGVRRQADNTRAELRDAEDRISGLVRQVRALRDRLDALEGA